MAMKHITDLQVCLAYQQARKDDFRAPDGSYRFAYDLLMEWTGQPFKVCWRCMERADDRGLVDYGINLRWGWLTPKGEALIASSEAAGGREDG